MATETFVSARTAYHPAGDPVAGVVVSAYDSNGDFVTRDSTDADGLVFLGELAAGDYEIRVTPATPGTVTGGNRQTITVIEDDDPLVFDIAVTTAGLSEADADDMCRCSGYFIDHAHRPAVGMVIEFVPTESRAYLLNTAPGSLGITQKPIRVTTDTDGFASVDLVQGQVYRVDVSGHDSHQTWQIRVPMLTSAPLPDVVFPFPEMLLFYDDGGNLLNPSEVTVTQGSSVYVYVRTVFRSGLQYAGAVGISMEAEEHGWMVDVSSEGDGWYSISGLSPGVVTCSFTFAEYEEGCGFRIYPVPAAGGELTITVADNVGEDDLDPPAEETTTTLIGAMSEGTWDGGVIPDPPA